MVGKHTRQRVAHTAIVVLSIVWGYFFCKGLGVFSVSLRNPDIYSERGTNFKEDITLTEEEVYRLIVKRDEPDSAYVLRLNSAVNKGLAHYWRDEGIDKYHMRVPIYENYVLYFLSYIYPGPYRKYEFYDYRKAINRGIGMCSQCAIILSQILNEKGIPCKIVGLGGHVVAMAQVDRRNDRWWVLDADLGVVIKHSIAEIERHPAIVGPCYAAQGYDAQTANDMVRVYGKEDNVIWESVAEYSGVKYYIERGSYIALWGIPLVALLPLVWGEIQHFQKALR